ncbi:hypothetical protein JCM10295v2_000610 [Rhodotorula toruloides]
MATLALPTLRQAPRPTHQLILSLFRPSPSSLPSLALSAPAVPIYALPSFANLVSDTLAGLRDLLPPILWAAPKSRTTHSAKRMRSAHKGLKEKQNLVSCPGCGAAKLAHHLCRECYGSFRREIHRERAEAGRMPGLPEGLAL